MSHSRKKITVNPRLEQVKIVVVGETSSWEPVPESNSSRKEAVRVELLTDGIRRECGSSAAM